MDEDEDADDEEEDDVIVCSFDWELSRLSREMSLFENELTVEARGIDTTLEQRLRTNEQRNGEASTNSTGFSLSTKNNMCNHYALIVNNRSDLTTFEEAHAVKNNLIESTCDISGCVSATYLCILIDKSFSKDLTHTFVHRFPRALSIRRVKPSFDKSHSSLSRISVILLCRMTFYYIIFDID